MSDNTAPPLQSPTERMVAMLADPRALFDRSQAVFLMTAAARWSAESARSELAELNLDALARAYAEPAFDHAAVERDRARRAARAAHDTAGREPRDGDHPGGPVLTTEIDPDTGAITPGWTYEPGRAERVLAYNAWLKQQPAVRVR